MYYMMEPLALDQGSNILPCLLDHCTVNLQNCTLVADNLQAMNSESRKRRSSFVRWVPWHRIIRTINRNQLRHHNHCALCYEFHVSKFFVIAAQKYYSHNFPLIRKLISITSSWEIDCPLCDQGYSQLSIQALLPTHIIINHIWNHSANMISDEDIIMLGRHKINFTIPFYLGTLTSTYVAKKASSGALIWFEYADRCMGEQWPRMDKFYDLRPILWKLQSCNNFWLPWETNEITTLKNSASLFECATRNLIWPYVTYLWKLMCIHFTTPGLTDMPLKRLTFVRRDPYDNEALPEIEHWFTNI